MSAERPSSASEPDVTPGSSTFASAAGSPSTAWAVAELSAPDDWTTRPVGSSPTAASTPGSCAARRTASEGSPGAPGAAATTRSAVRPARTCSAAECWRLDWRNTSVPQKAVTITIGTVAEASRREPARALSAASEAEAPAARSSTPTRPTAPRTSHGPSSPTATRKHITTPSAVFAAAAPGSWAATTASATAPAVNSAPNTVRTAPGAPGPAAASPSACVGRSRAQRRAANQPAPSAVTVHRATDTSSGSGPASSDTPAGTAPRATSSPNHQRASASPGSTPIADATGATSTASVAIARRT